MKARVWLAVGASAMTTIGCSEVYELDKYTTGDGASASALDMYVVPTTEAGPDGATADASSPVPGEAGAMACSMAVSLAEACTNAICVPFDNASRVPNFMPDAALAALPDAGAAQSVKPSDAGSASDASTSDGSASDAAVATGAALPACSTLPSPVYVIGSSGLVGLVAELGQLTADVPITVVFASARSCDGAKAVIENETASELGVATASYWDDTGTAHNCQIDQASEYADIGLGQLFADACLSLPQGTPGVGDFLGPVTPVDIVVPTASTQTSISGEALYYTIGFGNGAVAPWTDPNDVFFNPGSGPQYDVSLAIGVPVSGWKGTSVSSAAENIAKVGTCPDPEKALGEIGANLVEAAANTPTIKALAYQDFGESCGYYANATPTSFEKQNVRDGHYPLWGFSHMFTKVNPQNVPLNPNAATIVSYFTGNEPTPTGDFLKFVISDHLVPVCAMRVTRVSEMGRLSSFAPSSSCGCYFDSLTTGSSKCQVCAANSDCPVTAPFCNLGYCETN